MGRIDKLKKLYDEKVQLDGKMEKWMITPHFFHGGGKIVISVWSRGKSVDGAAEFDYKNGEFEVIKSGNYESQIKEILAHLKKWNKI